MEFFLSYVWFWFWRWLNSSLMRSMLSCTENLKLGGWLELWETGVGGTGPGAWGCRDRQYWTTCTQTHRPSYVCKHMVELQCWGLKTERTQTNLRHSFASRNMENQQSSRQDYSYVYINCVLPLHHKAKPASFSMSLLTKARALTERKKQSGNIAGVETINRTLWFYTYALIEAADYYPVSLSQSVCLKFTPSLVIFMSCLYTTYVKHVSLPEIPNHVSIEPIAVLQLREQELVLLSSIHRQQIQCMQ